jgi:hypothetical protein
LAGIPSVVHMCRWAPGVALGTTNAKEASQLTRASIVPHGRRCYRASGRGRWLRDRVHVPTRVTGLLHDRFRPRDPEMWPQDHIDIVIQFRSFC